MVTLTPQDFHPGSGKITELLFHPGVSLSIENLMELMLVISDNTAADVMLREAGGPAAVTARMRALGLNGIRVDRPTALLISDWVGASNLPPESQWNRDIWEQLYRCGSRTRAYEARRAQWNDPRDTATPIDMTDCSSTSGKRSVYARECRANCWTSWRRCQTGKARIKGMLPEGTEVAHKTGTLGGVVERRGRDYSARAALATSLISVFTKASPNREDAAEKAVAEVARTIYDYFVLVPASGELKINPIMTDRWDSSSLRRPAFFRLETERGPD